MHPLCRCDLSAVLVTFGLSTTKRNIVARMLVEGHDWTTIGRAVGWEPGTLRRYYEREAIPVSRLNPFSDASFIAQFIALATD